MYINFQEAGTRRFIQVVFETKLLSRLYIINSDDNTILTFDWVHLRTVNHSVFIFTLLLNLIEYLVRLEIIWHIADNDTTPLIRFL